MFGWRQSESALVERIARLERTVQAQDRVIRELAGRLGVDPGPSSGLPGLSDEVKRLVRDGKQVAAIKAYRAATGTSLIDAKAAVDEYAAQWKSSQV